MLLLLLQWCAHLYPGSWCRVAGVVGGGTFMKLVRLSLWLMRGWVCDQVLLGLLAVIVAGCAEKVHGIYVSVSGDARMLADVAVTVACIAVGCGCWSAQLSL